MESSFRKNLRDELDYQDLTVKELAAKTGIAKGALDCYLGKQASMPPANAAVKIAGALGVSVEYLVTGEKPREEDAQPAAKVRSILQILKGLNDNDQDILLGIAQVLRKHGSMVK
ncbi:MAG: helix-turn-helix domain-containing protein [Treponema sp.]|jgi:transcriptional regulator with XRE-family HTH domain|nr:helix-turn-helix domain-containing protein [Treponema sp.]